MYKYFVETSKMVSLKKEFDLCSRADYKKIKRLYEALGDTQISKEFLDGYLEYFDYSASRRKDAPLLKDSLIDLYEISKTYSLSSLGIKMIMGEYVKDLFDEIKPLRYFDSKSLKEMDDSFEEFMYLLKQEADKSDLKYKEELLEADSLSYMYGERFTKFIKEIILKYHKTFDEVYYSIPYSWVIRKDSDLFYDIAKKEIFGAFGYPYSYLMCKHMILFGDIDSYKDRDLIYSSSLKGYIYSPISADDFLESVEQKRKELIIRKKG